MRLPLFLAFIGCVGLAPAAANELISINRDRSSFYPEVTIPFDFDGRTGKGIAWKTPLPNWSASGPIVAGGKVFCTAEPWETDGYSPWLLCIDADSGKELWRQELDAVDAFPKGEQAAMRKLASETWAWWRGIEALWIEAFKMHDENQKSFQKKGRDLIPPAELAGRWNEIRKQVQAEGFDFRLKSGAGGPRAPFKPQRKGKAEKRVAALQEVGLIWDKTWRGFGTWLGVGYPTPCADNSRVWTVTMHQLWSCHDHDGKVVWQKRFAPPKLDQFSPELRQRVAGGKKGWNPRFPGPGGASTSPLLVDVAGDGSDLVVIAELYQVVRCLDADDGTVRWALPMSSSVGQAGMIPGSCRIDGEAIFISGASSGPPGLELIRIRDGVTVGRVPGGLAGKGPSHGPVVVDDLVITRGGKGTLAHRLSWNADQSAIVTTKIYDVSPDKKFMPVGRTSWDGERIFCPHTGVVMDIQSGKKLPVKIRGAHGYYGWNGFIVGDVGCVINLYGKDNKAAGRERYANPVGARDATYTFFNLDTGKRLGVGKLPINPEDGASKELKMANEFRRPTWRWMSSATPYAVDDRLYVRSYDFLWCIGR